MVPFPSFNVPFQTAEACRSTESSVFVVVRGKLLPTSGK
jgi:hypothetical protein